MIDPPSSLIIRRQFERATEADVAGFRGVPISMLADAQRGRGGLDHRIQQVGPDRAIVGIAVTAWCGAADNLGALAALELAQPGDVIVIACDGFDGVGVVGDRFAGMARNKGLAGIVVDGLVRDRPGIRSAGMPCFARGTSANSAYSLGPGEAGLPIAIGGVRVAAGDVIVGDSEGVVVVAREAVADVLEALKVVRRSEVLLDREVADGSTGFGWVSDLMLSDRTRHVD